MASRRILGFVSAGVSLWAAGAVVHMAPPLKFDVMHMSSDELAVHVARATGKWIVWSEEQYVQWLLQNYPETYYDSSLGRPELR